MRLMSPKGRGFDEPALLGDPIHLNRGSLKRHQDFRDHRLPMKKFEYEGALLALAFLLGPLMENNLRKSLIMSQGDFSIFFTRPLAAASLIIALFLLVSPFLPYLRKKREELPKEEVS